MFWYLDDVFAVFDPKDRHDNYTEDPDFDRRFPSERVNRNNRNLFCGLLVFGLFFFGAFTLPEYWMFGFVGLALLVFCGAWLYLSVSNWSKDYTEDEWGLIVPGPTFKYSIMGGRANDPYVDMDNKLRACLKASHKIPKDANAGNFRWSCVEIEGDRVVFNLWFYGVYGAYEFMNKEKDRLAVEFGDPDGAEFEKVGSNKYELVFDKLGSEASFDANVSWR